MPALYERNQVGKREELADIIANIEVTACPVTSMIRKEKKPNQKVIDFQAEVYPDRGFKGVLDGKDADDFNHTPRYPLKAVSQKVWENPSVTDFAEETVVAGIPGRGEMKRQKAISLVQVKRMGERRFLSDEECREDDGANPNETRGLGKWLQATAQAVFPVPEAVRTPAASIFSGTLAAFTEEKMQDLLQSSFNVRKGNSSLKLVSGTKLKRLISSWSIYAADKTSNTVVRTINQDAKSRQLINVIDRLVCDTGDVDIMLSPYLYCDATSGAQTAKSLRSGFLLDVENLALCYTRMPRIKDLEDRGGGPRAIVDAIFALLNYAPHGMGKIEIEADA